MEYVPTIMITPENVLENVTQWWCIDCQSHIGGTRLGHMKSKHQYWIWIRSTSGNYIIDRKLKESDIANHDSRDRFLGMLENTTEICPYCDSLLFRYVGMSHLEWIGYSCHNNDCKYKKLHNSHFTRHEFIGTKKKYFHDRHLHNSDTKKCSSCRYEKESRFVMAKINRILTNQ